jgi:Ni/Co efflux regulator RcnB
MKKVLSLLFVSFAFMATSFAQKQTSKAAVLLQKGKLNTEKAIAEKMAKQKLAEEKAKQQQKKSSSEEAALSNAAPAATGTKQKK